MIQPFMWQANHLLTSLWDDETKFRERVIMQLKFEAAIFNAEVLQALSDGGKHRNLSDDWAETHYIEFYASDIEMAWEKIQQKYRADRGFVIKAIDKIS